MRVYVDVTDEKGVVTTWNLELGSPNSVLRRGWKRADLQVGEKVTFKGFGGRKILTRAVADAHHAVRRPRIHRSVRCARYRTSPIEPPSCV